MSGDSKPGAWVDGIGWVAKLHSLDVGTRARLGDIGPPFVVSVVDRVQIPGNPVAVVVRWADGTTPAAPSGHNDGDWVCVGPTFTCHPERGLQHATGHKDCGYRPTPSPDTVTVPKAEWDALAEAVGQAAGRMGQRWMLPIGDRAVALIGASRRAAGAVR